ncbi:MAG TPA: DUF5666 domain-containing protein [Steroidobacteraceae bacterium]|jgi:hypothetical protein|nr:DUF5666 domain-containing protein [Steroidobacteraceae bacterium]
MPIASRWNRLSASLTGALIALCPGCGGDQMAGIEGSGAPVASSVVTTGRITGFGSIIVDGVEYATSDATIRIDDQPGTEAQLHIGDIVTIEGALDAAGVQGTARDVSFKADARGTVSQVDAAAGTFVVLGQTVAVDNDTIFDAALQASDLTELPPSVPVQVSGFRDATGTLLASRIDPAATSDLQVKGRVEALDATAHTFRIGALTVDYTTAAISGSLASGSKVTARGTTQAATGALLASQVQVESAGPGGGRGAADATRQLEGVITRFASNSDFDVDGERVTTDSATQFVLHDATLGPNVRVKVLGKLDSAGALLASTVEVKGKGKGNGSGSGSGGGPASAGPIAGIARGPVDSVSSSAGTLTVLGIVARASDDTALEDRSDAKVKAFRLSDVRTGDYVEVRGDFAEGAIDATLVKRDKPETHSYLQGVAGNLAAPTFTLLGVTITTSPQTDFKGPGGVKTASDFFAAAAGKTVKVRGMLNGSTFEADQVQLMSK